MLLLFNFFSNTYSIQMTDNNNNPHNSRVRPYRKSSSSRLRWTPELHEHFVEVVRNLGGKYRATPKKIMHMMGVNGLKIAHIKSHLQMHRSIKEHAKFGCSMSTKGHQKVKPHHRREDVVKEEEARRKQAIFEIKEKFDNKEDNDRYYCQGTQGTSNSAITESEHAEFSRADMELNFFALGDIYHENNSESSRNTTINLDLTM